METNIWCGTGKKKEGNKCASAASLGKEGRPHCSLPGNNDSGYNTFCRIKATRASFKTLYFITSMLSEKVWFPFMRFDIWWKLSANFALELQTHLNCWLKHKLIFRKRKYRDIWKKLASVMALNFIATCMQVSNTACTTVYTGLVNTYTSRGTFRITWPLVHNNPMIIIWTGSIQFRCSVWEMYRDIWTSIGNRRLIYI